MPGPENQKEPQRSAQEREIQRIEQLRDDFELACKSGSATSFDEQLNGLDGTIRRDAFRELLSSYVELANNDGVAIDDDDLRSRFPEMKDIIDAVIDSHQQTQITDRTPAAVHSSTSPRASGLPEPGDRLGRYLLIRKLGQGGMGTVFQARDDVLKREVAIKIPQFVGQNSDVLIERFYREARTMAAINHTNLCTVHDVDRIDGYHCLVMDYIDGESLADRIKRGGEIAPEDIPTFFAKLARAVQVAHDAGVIHRDLKPANILLGKDDEPVVMDFGLARTMFSTSDAAGIGLEGSLTITGTVIGTPMYMSPEQVEGDRHRIGTSSDLYSLGVILYLLLCGRLPFEGSVARVLSSIANDEPVPPSRHNSLVSRTLEAICLKLLQKSPADRFPSCNALVDALEQATNSDDTWNLLDEFRVTARSLSLTLKLTLAGLALVAIGTALSFWNGSDNQRANDDRASTSPVEPAELPQEIVTAFEEAHGIANSEFTVCPQMPFEVFTAMVTPLRESGYEPLDVRPYADKQQLRVATVWRKGSGDWMLKLELTFDEFEIQDRLQQDDGRTIQTLVCYQPTLQQRFSDRDEWRFAALWKRSETPTKWRYYESVSPPITQHDESDPLYAEGWRPVRINGFVQRPTMGGFCQIWEPNAEDTALIRPTSTDTVESDEQRSLGRTPTSVFLTTWPPDVLVMQHWRERSTDETTLICQHSATEHLVDCHSLTQYGWQPIAIGATPMLNSSEVAVGSVWQRRADAESH